MRRRVLFPCWSCVIPWSALAFEVVSCPSPGTLPVEPLTLQSAWLVPCWLWGSRVSPSPRCSPELQVCCISATFFHPGDPLDLHHHPASAPGSLLPPTRPQSDSCCSHCPPHSCTFPLLGVILEGGDPSQGRRVGSCLTLRNELSRRYMRWQSKRLDWEGVPGR